MTVTFGAPTFYGGSNPPVAGDGATIAGYRYSTDGGYVYSPIYTNPFTVTGLTNGTAQTVYVVADNNASLTSASGSTTTTPRTTPSAPASVTLTPGNNSVSVAFTAPSGTSPTNDGGSAISSYEYSTNGSSYTATPSNPFTVSGTNGTAITVYVRAVNDVGAGSATSNSATPRTVPSAPQSFAGSNTTFGQLSLSWAAPSSNGGNAVSSYVLRTGSTVLQNTSATSYVHTGLSPYTDYSYTVTAANAAGEGTAASLTVKTMGGVAKVWNGTAWVTVLPKVYNGAAWVESQARMWDGSEWKHGI
jgi:titin